MGSKEGNHLPGIVGILWVSWNVANSSSPMILAEGLEN